MTGAYDEMYLDDAMKNLGEAFDYAANGCKIDLDDFMDMFVNSSLAEQFGRGNPKYISGRSGVELAIEILTRLRMPFSLADNDPEYYRTPEYWCGWILAYCQWKTKLSFEKIHRYISMKELLDLYTPLHEAPEEKTAEVLNKIIARTNSPTELKIIRQAAGLSQKALAEKSGVSLRMIQQYEQRKKNINKASIESLMNIAGVLGCRPEDLTEYAADFI